MRALVQEQMEASSYLQDADSICCLADGFRALADATRLHIIHLLMTRGEMCVCEFMPALDLTQSNVSFHLKTLKQARFITSRKDGRWMYYSLNRRAFDQFRADFGRAFDFDKWPEKTEPASCEISACRQMERR